LGKTVDIKTLLTTGRNYLLCGLTLIAIGLSISKPLINLGILFMCFSWIVDGKIIERFNRFKSNKIALILCSIYFISLLGLIHTSNFEYGLDDVRRKLPLLLPMLIAGFSPLTKKEVSFLLKVFVGWVVFACCWSFCVYFGVLNEVIVDFREYSRFNSHIRFGLEIALGIFFCAYFFHQTKEVEQKVFWSLILSFLLLSLYVFSLFTGTLVLIATLILILLVFGISAKKKRIKYLAITCFFSLVIGVSFFIKNAVNTFYACNKIEPLKEIAFTKNGEKYQKDDFTNNSTNKENGYFIYKNIAWHELGEAWSNKSKIPFEGRDLKGQDLKFTLIRFITSKGLRKDKEAIDGLTEEEILAIEQGVSNYKYLKMNGLSVRLHKIIWEYDSYVNGGDINGHSVLMRWEYWKTAFSIIKSNLVLGVGTGDVQDAFNEQYDKDNSILSEPYRLRAHNQYITYVVTMGTVGLIWFLIVLFYPIIKTKAYKNYLYLTFFSIACLSMLTEDTLETIVGINFFVFFNSIFLLKKE
jgi:hypothetical protein